LAFALGKQGLKHGQTFQAAAFPILSLGCRAPPGSRIWGTFRIWGTLKKNQRASKSKVIKEDKKTQIVFLVARTNL